MQGKDKKGLSTQGTSLHFKFCSLYTLDSLEQTLDIYGRYFIQDILR